VGFVAFFIMRILPFAQDAKSKSNGKGECAASGRDDDSLCGLRKDRNKSNRRSFDSATRKVRE
jgi:hypothetical protein